MANLGCIVAKVLIVDDDKHARLLYEEELSSAGYTVVLAADGKEALVVINREQPDLVILDIRMPEMNGLEALGKIIANDRKASVILHSAFKGYKDDFLSWRADAYVEKSTDLQELKDTIRDLLGKKKR